MKVLANRNIFRLPVFKLSQLTNRILFSHISRNFAVKEKFVNTVSYTATNDSDKPETVGDPLKDDESRRAAEERVGFQKLLDFLLKREQYTWQDYLQQTIYTNEKDRSVWKRFRLKKDEEKKEVEDTNKFVAALFPDEHIKEDFTVKEMRDIAKITDVNEGFIVLMMNNYRYHKGLHTYLRELQSKGEPLPKSPEELFELTNSTEPPKFVEDFQKKMYKEVLKRLQYTEDYVQREEHAEALKRAKKSKRTCNY